jgi:hypothetical protein
MSQPASYVPSHSFLSGGSTGTFPGQGWTSSFRVSRDPRFCRIQLDGLATESTYAIARSGHSRK